MVSIMPIPSDKAQYEKQGKIVVMSLEGVVNHQTRPKHPQINFWDLPPEDCAGSTVLHQEV